MAEWGRKEYSKAWPSRTPIWTWTAILLSFAFFTGMLFLFPTWLQDVQHESIVDFKFRAGAPNRNYDDARAADKAAYAAYYHNMLERGILLPPSQNEVMFVSTAHTAQDVDETVAAIGDSISA